MENNKWPAEPIRVSVSLGLLGSCKKDHTMGWELLSVMSARPRGSVRLWLHREVQDNTNSSSLMANVAGNGQLLPRNGGRSTFLVLTKHLFQNQPGRVGRAWLLKSDRTWIQVLIPPLRTWASSGASVSLSIKWDHNYPTRCFGA